MKKIYIVEGSTQEYKTHWYAGCFANEDDALKYLEACKKEDDRISEEMEKTQRYKPWEYKNKVDPQWERDCGFTDYYIMTAFVQESSDVNNLTE